MTRQRVALGEYGEQLAVLHLLAQGMTVLDRNWRCPAGEIDIVARDGLTVVFVEVKTRRDERYGHPAEAVHPRKVQRLRRLAARWLVSRELHPHTVRFDVVAVLSQPLKAEIEHIKGAF